LLIRKYLRIGMWTGWQCLKQGVPRVVVDAKNISKECPERDHKGLEENGYRYSPE